MSKPSYEQVSSAVEVEREAHRRTHMKLVEKESRLAALETKEAAPGVIQAPAPTPTALACRETGEKERLSLALSAREAELLAEKHRTSTLQREKTALARSLDEKETELRALRQTAMTERVIPASPELARAPDHQDRGGSLGSAEDEANEMPFYVDADAPDPLPSEPTNAQP